MLRIPFMDKRVSPVVVGETSALSRRSRFLAAVAGGGLVVVLALASQLRPDPRGWGTHEQLGLPPCTFLTVAGIRCPACGMTTAWSNFMHGRMADALRANASGTVLAAVALVVAGWMLAVAIRGRPLPWQPGETTIAAAAVALTALMIGEWIVRVWAQ